MSNKIFHIDREISTELVTQFTDFITNLEQEDELLIMMNSNGGSVVAGFALYDLIAGLTVPTTCNIIGMCASAATYAAMACERVIMQPTATYMIHEVSGWLGGTPREIKRDLDYMEDLQSRMIAMYAAKAQYIDIAAITEMVEQTTYMTAQQALDYGFVDEVPGLVRQPITECENKEESETKEEPKEGIVNRIISIFNRPKSDDIIKAPTEAEILVNEEVMKLNNQLMEKDMELDNLHKSLEVKEQEFENKVADKEAEIERMKEEYHNKIEQAETAVKLEVANRLAALGYDDSTLPAPASPINNSDLSIYDKLQKEFNKH